MVKILFAKNFSNTGIMFIAAVALCQSAVAGVIKQNPSADDSAAYSALAANSKYTSVGKLTADSSIGSGVKIGDEWVLTAAHHVAGKSNLSFDLDGATYTATNNNVIIYNGIWDGDFDAGQDLALINFSDGLGNTEAANLWFGGSVVGKVGTNVGFGATGKGEEGTNGTTGLGTKNAGQNMIDFTGDQINFLPTSGNILYQDFDSGDKLDNFPFASSSSDPLDLEFLTAPGDSGGGLFVDHEGLAYLVGIHSFVSNLGGTPKSAYGDYAGSTRIAGFSDWIQATTGIGQTPVPEPSTYIMFGTAFSILVFIGYRKR